MTYKDELEMILDSIEARRSICLKELKHLPKGRLYTEKAGKYQQYRRIYKRNGELIRETLAKDSDLLLQMKRRSYFESELAILDGDATELRNAISSIKGNSFDMICRDLPNRIGSFPFEETLITSESGLLIPRPVLDADVPIRELELKLGDIDPYQWAVMPYRENASHLDEKRHIGTTGLRYRSRAEMHIFEHIITKRKHPVHYDEVIEIDGEFFSPDGLMPNVFKDIMLIEYAEKEDEDYLRRNARKFDAYRRKGFVPGRNLIILSCETNGFINTPKLDKILDAYLLM